MIIITKMTEQHLINSIKFFRKKLANMPVEAIYIGDSVYAEDCVNMENNHNRALAEDINGHIRKMKKELKKRGVVFD